LASLSLLRFGIASGVAGDEAKEEQADHKENPNVGNNFEYCHKNLFYP
jgi:hypothetical protein